MSFDKNGENVAEEQFDPVQAREMLRFQMSYNKQRIKSTWAIAIVIVGMYLLEELFGGSNNVAVLVRMGANVSERVHEGEYYRLLTSVFLHAGFMHVFFNTYVLFALGGFFNRILGETRYLTVFFVSGLTGSLASVYFGNSGVSVGASGAIWGLFGASLGLAFFQTSLIPETIRLRLRRVTLINLIINLGVSFLPMIDFWAHIGGGIGGFLVSLLIIFPSRNEAVFRGFSVVFRILALIFGVLYASSIIYVMGVFQPWTDQLNAKFVPQRLPEVSLTVSVPEGLDVTTGTNNSAQNSYYVFGDPKSDRLVIELHFFNAETLGVAVDKAWLTKQRDDLLAQGSVPADVKKSIYLRDDALGGLLYYQQPTRKNEIVVHNYVITRKDYAIRLSLISTSNVTQARVDDVAKKVLESIH